jgi:hypothetical protein
MAVVDCLESTNGVGLPGPVLAQRVAEKMLTIWHNDSDSVKNAINVVINTGLRQQHFVLAGANVRLASWGARQ